MGTKFRAMYADGSLAGQWDNRSELDSFLAHSANKDRHEVTDRQDDNNFTISDKQSGRTLLVVTGPRAEQKPAEPTNESSDNTAA